MTNERIRRVNLDHLARRLRSVLAPALVREIVADIEAHPEGHVEDSRATDEARMMVRQAIEASRRRT